MVFPLPEKYLPIEKYLKNNKENDEKCLKKSIELLWLFIFFKVPWNQLQF